MEEIIDKEKSRLSTGLYKIEDGQLKEITIKEFNEFRTKMALLKQKES